MYAPLAAILIALAVVSVLALRMSRASRPLSPSSDPEQLEGFIYVGAGALILLAGLVVLVGLWGDRTGRAEGLAMFGFFTYAIYLLAALVIERLTTRR